MAGGTDMEWIPEHDTLLRRMASTDEVESEWNYLREVIKCKIQQNIVLFLTTTQQPPLPLGCLPVQTGNGGLKLPPFPPRVQLHVPKPPVCYMDEDQAKEMKENIFQLLHQFEGSPPFTIQRLCELCIDPKKHYNSVGKYLRAVEKSILVTSTLDSFPPLTEAEVLSAGRSAITLGSTLQSAPGTPLFSPIPFLHDDARRSKSRSPPPSTTTTIAPLSLDANTTAAGEEPVELRALGLVDELDDPRPGHLSDHPVALSSVTTLPADSSKLFSISGSLTQRFVKAGELDSSFPSEVPAAMELDEDKENTKT